MFSAVLPSQNVTVKETRLLYSFLELETVVISIVIEYLMDFRTQLCTFTGPVTDLLFGLVCWFVHVPAAPSQTVKLHQLLFGPYTCIQFTSLRYVHFNTSIYCFLTKVKVCLCSIILFCHFFCTRCTETLHTMFVCSSRLKHARCSSTAPSRLI